MINIIFIHNGKSTTVKAKGGETLLQLAEQNSIPLIGGCGGACVCGSCHVEIDSTHASLLQEADLAERDILECLPMYNPTSRLACQVKVTPEMDGMTVTII